MTAGVDNLVERLVAQFASPYDFLRELVQNAMDAGSDTVDVMLHTHRGDAPGEVVFELEVVDVGEGMDEAIIDGELTRLFGTSKTADRTMAGGFGIGFVSVFAWEPERVVVQTGRRGEAWELVFFPDRRFEKHRVDMPLEGTCIRLFRRGAAAERERIAEAVYDALWRWCRFCPVQLSFEDLQGDDGLREITASATDGEADAAATVAVEHGQTRFRMAFAAVPHATLMRHGLVLAEGRLQELLPRFCARAGRSVEHLDVWVDSPRLRTGLTRDGVIDDEGRAALEEELVQLLDALREALLTRVEAVARSAEWTPQRADELGFLHAHLQPEHDIESLELHHRAVLRLASTGAVSARALGRRARLGVVAIVGPDTAVDPQTLPLRLVAVRSGIPVLVARWPTDEAWLRGLLDPVGLRPRPLSEVVSRLQPVERDSDALGALTVSMLSELQFAPARIRLGSFPDAEPGVFGGVAVGESGVVTGAEWSAALVEGGELWLAESHPVVARARRVYLDHPELAALALALAIGARLHPPPQLDELAKSWAVGG